MLIVLILINKKKFKKKKLLKKKSKIKIKQIKTNKREDKKYMDALYIYINEKERREVKKRISLKIK